MGWFDPPNVALRKRTPTQAIPHFDAIEQFADRRLRSELPQHKPYQVGVVLALWLKAGEMSEAMSLSFEDSKKIQAIYESCMKLLKHNSYAAFTTLVELSRQDQMFGMPDQFYLQLAANVA